MSLQIVHLLPERAEEAGHLVYEAFLELSTRHAFEPVYESRELCVGFVRFLARLEGFTPFLALEDGRPVAVNFLDGRDEAAGVGPVAVAVEAQGHGHGRRIMEALMDEAAEAGFRSVRLLQQGYNMTSFSLYSSLGFEVKDLLALLRGRPSPGEETRGDVREAVASDLEEMDRLSVEVLGLSRRRDIETMMAVAAPLLVERHGRLAGYLCRFVGGESSYLGHAAARDAADLRDLIIGAARTFPRDLRLPMPVSQPELLRWLLRCGFAVKELDTLMAWGPYEAPRGPYLPSPWY